MKLLVQVELSIGRDVGNATRWLKGMIRRYNRRGTEGERLNQCAGAGRIYP